LAIAKADGRFEEEGWRIRKDGSRFWANVTITAVKNDGSKATAFLKITRDLTARKLAEEQQERLIREQAARSIAEAAQEKAEAANREKDRILHVLSHELRNPLMPILFSCSMLVDDPDVPEKVREHLQVIKKHAAMQARLIDDLLDVTKIAKGKFQLSLAVIDVHEVLRTVVETCSADLESKQLAFSIELKATNYHLGADADRLQQVFWNLLKNASSCERSIREATCFGWKFRIPVKEYHPN
jgi:signal transduction histidine kinase